MSVPVATVAQAWLAGRSPEEAQRAVVELAAIQGSVATTPSVRRFVADPRRSTTTKVEQLAAAGVSAPVRDVLRWLLESRRLHDLAALVQQARRVAHVMGGPSAASVVSTLPLTDAERHHLVTRLEKVAGRAVALEEKTDPGILGGLIITLAGQRRDLSIRGRISALRRAAAS